VIGSVRAWFAALTLREKRLVLVALALALLTFFWFGLIRPIGDALASAKARHNDAVVRLAETERALRVLAEMQRNRPAPLAAPLEVVIRERAAAAGFTLANLVPAPGNGVQVQLASARPAALFGWIGALEEDGILVDTLTTSDNGDKTLSATISFKARGA